jgi:hypothetical protein
MQTYKDANSDVVVAMGFDVVQDFGCPFDMRSLSAEVDIFEVEWIVFAVDSGKSPSWAISSASSGEFDGIDTRRENPVFGDRDEIFETRLRQMVTDFTKSSDTERLGEVDESLPRDEAEFGEIFVYVQDGCRIDQYPDTGYSSRTESDDISTSPGKNRNFAVSSCSPSSVEKRGSFYCQR